MSRDLTYEPALPGLTEGPVVVWRRLRLAEARRALVEAAPGDLLGQPGAVQQHGETAVPE